VHERCEEVKNLGVLFPPALSLEKLALFATVVASTIHKSVRFIEGMTVPAIHLRSAPPALVHLFGDCFQMIGPNTQRRAAEVIDLKPRRNHANMEFITKAVGRLMGSGFGAECAVSIRGLGSDPEPAIIGLVDLLPEPLLWRLKALVIDGGHSSILQEVPS
jgi:hypothetical protein